MFGEVSRKGKRLGPEGGYLVEFGWEGRGWGWVGFGSLLEAGCLLSFSAFRMGSPAGDEISNPGLNCTIVSLHYLFIA